MLDFLYGPFAKTILALSLTGIVLRTAFFAKTFNDGNPLPGESEPHYVLRILGRWILPLHKAFVQKPAYAASRYLFHFLLIITPLGANGHLTLFEESSLGLPWGALPDEWTHRMGLAVLCCLAWFMVRKLIFPNLRKTAATVEYFLIVLTSLPFLTGFMAAEGWWDYELIMTVHVLGGGAILVAAILMFCRSTVNNEKCKSCSACVMTCPTGALAANDQARTRTFEYSHYQCICCAGCVVSCPEYAVGLRHRIGFKLFWERKRTVDRTAEIALCEQCFAPFIPISQREQVDRLIAEKGLDKNPVQLCERCKRRSILLVAESRAG